MGVRIRNARRTRLEIDLRLKRAQKAAEAEVKAGAELIAERAKEMTPVDAGNLEDAIEMNQEGRSRFLVEIDNNYPVEKAKSGRMSVGAYAYLVHEDIRPEGMAGEYGEKAQANGKPDAGPFFFDRAREEIEPEIIDAVRKATKRATR